MLENLNSKRIYQHDWIVLNKRMIYKAQVKVFQAKQN